LFLFPLLTPHHLFSQVIDSLQIITEYVDKTDVAKIIKGKNSVNKNTGIPEKGKLMAFPGPIFGATLHLEHILDLKVLV